jgi:histidinol phosphatase-like enzyme
MLIQAATDLNLDLEKSWLIGDAITDIEAAVAAKVNPILVSTGRGAEQAYHLENNTLAHIPFVKDLYDAAEYVLGNT